MAAMTMEFKVKDARQISGVQAGDEVTFQLHVTEDESWVDGIVKTGDGPLMTWKKPPPGAAATRPDRTLLDYKFTNELGQAVSLNDFRGQVLAITFFYTRCPLPDYCPRLSKNFQSASRKLAAMTNAPANWHFISFSFDPAFDSPAMLRAYGLSYGYDPAHWSFLTGPADKIAEFVHRSGVNYELEDGAFNHNFRTLILDARGRLRMVFPTGGDLSDPIVSEMLKAAAVTNLLKNPDK
jgi:protein SCO1/2